MGNDELRDLQNAFIRTLKENGFFNRNKDGWNVSLFEKGSPTAVQLQTRLYSAYQGKMQEYLARFEQIEEIVVEEDEVIEEITLDDEDEIIEITIED